MTSALSLVYAAPALSALAVLAALLGTAANWFSRGFVEQIRNSVVMVVILQGAILAAESAGWTESTSQGDVVTWSFGIYVLTLAVWWTVDAAEFLRGRARGLRRHAR